MLESGAFLEPLREAFIGRIGGVVLGCVTTAEVGCVEGAVPGALTGAMGGTVRSEQPDYTESVRRCKNVIIKYGKALPLAN
jgi:outer membrane lipoprotein SlyB